MATVPTARPASAFGQALRQFGDRLFEAAPGLTTWILLLTPAWIPIVFHSTGAILVATVVLVYDIYWLFRSITVVSGIYSTSRSKRGVALSHTEAPSSFGGTRRKSSQP